MARPGVFITESVLPTPIDPAPPSSAAGAMVATLPSGPSTPTLVTSWYQFTEVFGTFSNSFPATYSAWQFFQNGGSELYVARAVWDDAVAASADLEDATPDVIATFTALSVGAWGNDLRVRVSPESTTNYFKIDVFREGSATATPDNVTDDVLLETFRNVVFNDATSSDYAETVINQLSAYVTVAVVDGDLTVPATATVLPLTGGDDGGAGTGIEWTAAIDALTLVDRTFVLFSPAQVDSTVVSALVTAAETYGWFVVLDTAAGLTASAAKTYGEGLDKTSHAAVYYPHLWVTDPAGRSSGSIKLVPPSGSVVGAFLYTDTSTGVFKAPAGVGTGMRGVVATESVLTNAELDDLNNDVAPVNVVRMVPGTGACIMGARTLDQSASTRYVNVRRTLLFLTRELQDRLQFALFENNDERLWSNIRAVLGVFLNQFWQAGGLRGTTQDAAFFVKCDAENNPPNSIANGNVNITVGVALQYPAEFININLSQKTLS